MKVFLPSHGIFGQKIVNLRIPTFGDLRDVQSYNQDELLKKYYFVQKLSNVELSKVTAMDMDYLFQVVAFSLLFNVVRYKVICPDCNEAFESDVSFIDQDIKEIKDLKLPYHKRINTTKYTYTLLSAQQMIDAYQWAVYEEDTKTAFEDAQVALIMGKSLKDVDKVKKLPISIYLGAFLFQKLNYHGIDYLSEATCPKCGKKFKFSFTLSTDVLAFDADTMMHKFQPMANWISFSDFLKLSIVDFNALVDTINDSLK